MRLYSGGTGQFIEDCVRNQIAEKLRSAYFEHFRYYPAQAEVASWRNSLRAFSQVLDHGGLKDHGIIVEYQLPLTSKRLDCLVCGRDPGGFDNAVIVELKQWEKCGKSETEGTVQTWVGGAYREVLHPSVQVGQYAMYLQDFHTAFYEQDPVRLAACSYLHNYTPASDDYLYHQSFEKAIVQWPLFNANDYTEINDFLHGRLERGNGLEVLQRVEQSRLRPSKKLMDHVASVIRGKREYVLLDEQLVVYNKVLACAREGFHNRKRNVILVKGGPGTGKSVIAINLLADLLTRGYNAQYATGSRAFTETLRRIIGPRGSGQFKYFNSYGDAEPNAIDVLVADEAHRLREHSYSRFTRKQDRSDRAQVDELMRVAKVGVFFIDDDQVVRPGEVGSSELIRKHAERTGSLLHEYVLEAQFRCSGSDAFVSWVSNTLGIHRTANVIWEQKEEFDFRIFPSPAEVETAIRERVLNGASGRITAGFCWPWSLPDHSGHLVKDVAVGGYKRAWNARPEAGRLARGIPKAVHWAHDPNGIDQVGCIYTAQGFEFDFVGVIFGKDLRYDLDKQQWIGDPSESYDSVVRKSKGRFLDLVKNTYRVLLSRGMKGCYVCFLDKDTERFFRSRIE
jgi:DUF2075 family protein